MVGGIEEVARLAGVSTATVSRALRGLPNVSESTRDRVRAAAAMIGYVPTPSASSLASGRTRSIGVLTPWVSRWYFANVIEGVERELREVGYDALLYTFKVERRGRQPVDVEVLRRRVDGVLVVGLPLGTYEVESLFALRLPVVFVGAGIEGRPTVRIDDYAVGRTAVEHLISLGHERIGHITGLPDLLSAWSPPIGRRRGWHDALASAGIAVPPEWMASGYFDMEGGRESAAALLEQAPEITAVFAASDELAMGVLLAARDAGLRVPEDVSVVGVDGHDAGELLGLTTVAQPAGEQGCAAARLLLEMIGSGDSSSAEPTLFPTELVVRSSTASPGL
jgi:LacI family repressor for deo operon, udp, cdd, tsx, nupC, and nupG